MTAAIALTATELAEIDVQQKRAAFEASEADAVGALSALEAVGDELKAVMQRVDEAFAEYQDAESRTEAAHREWVAAGEYRRSLAK